MSLSLAEIKRAKVQSFRDVADALDSMASANRDMKRGVERLPIMGDGWKGVSGDAAHHDIDAHAKYLDAHAQAQQGAAGKIRRAADEFEGVQQLLKKIESDAAQGKFTINDETGEVTPPNGKYDKNELDYLTNTLRQIRAAGDAANTDLEAAVKAAQTLPDPSGATGALPVTPNSSTKPDGSFGALQNLATARPDGRPAETQAAAAGADTQANYKEWYPKNAVPVGDKNVDPSKLGGVGSIPGVRDNVDKIPQRMSSTLQPKDVPAFKDLTRQNLQRLGVPADQIEAKVNAAVEQAQTPHFLPDAPAAGDGNANLSKSPGERFIDFTNDVHEGFYQSADGAVQQGKELTGQAGPGAPGVAEAWSNLAKDSGKALFEQTVNPIGSAIDQAQQAVNDPGHFAGHKLFEATAVAPTLPLGGEGAALARGLEGGAIERGLLGDVTHLDDGVGHHTPSIGDHSIPSTVDHHPYASVPHEAPAPPPLPPDHPLFEGYHPTDPGPNYTNPDGSLRYPNDLDPAKPYAVPGTVIDNAQLPKGTILGRFGYPGGEWLAPEGTSFAKLSLPPDSAMKPYFEYAVSDPTKLPPGWRIEQSQVAPWFNQPGMGPQYRVIAPPGQEASVDALARYGFLERIGRQ
ncbi:TNT domain-containing protein [Mycobacteroides chelonae]|uniref:TNT domain-containing protein n=1 Tax=Mycobacteroides chelonae TaxID=1774 RepID=UPI0009947D4D|nr:TNT domain-containing protein [Mycobacteroides chelonae]